MNRLIVSLCILTVLISLTGCKREPPSYTVCLLDVSKSISPDGLNYEFKSVDGLIDTLKRGDRLTVIPITGSAIGDTPGHILRFAAPTQRQPYDHDLAAFRQESHKRIEAMRDAALVRPSLRTDILGTLDLAREEFAADSDRHQVPQSRALVILTDFVEDDGAYRFAFDPALASDVSARALADQLRRGSCLALGDVRVRLGTVESNDLRNLKPQRQKAIRAFWSDYLSRRPTPTTSRGALKAVDCEEGNTVFRE